MELKLSDRFRLNYGCGCTLPIRLHCVDAITRTLSSGWSKNKLFLSLGNSKYFFKLKNIFY
jgi:hypothetical protein